MGDIVRDLRFTWRSLRRSPFAVGVALLSLALGVGANLTIFTFVRALLFPSIPVKEPQRLVSVFTRDSATPYVLPTSYPNFRDLRDRAGMFEGLVAAVKFPLMLGRGQDAARVLGELVSADYFSILGVQPQRGRPFLPEENRTPGASPVAIVSYDLWVRRFAQDPALIGRAITLNGHAFNVVGIAPRGFRGTAVGVAVDVWAPTMMYDPLLSTYRAVIDMRNVLFFEVVGKLKPGASFTAAEAAIRTIGAQLEKDYPDENKGRSLTVIPFREARPDPNSRRGVVLAAAVLMMIAGLVLLIACVNLANVQLARTMARRRELAVCLALGASRGRLIRQILTESLVIALGGGALALGVAAWATRSIWAGRPPSDVPLSLDLSLDYGLLAFGTVLSLLAAVAFGLGPALRASGNDLLSALKDDGAAFIGKGSRRMGLREVLLAVQVCGSLFVLVAAGLFVRSLQATYTSDPGFEPANVVAMTFDPGLYGYSDTDGRRVARRFLERARELPGVRAASLAERLPVNGGSARTVVPEGHALAPGEHGTLVQMNIVSDGYFETLGIPLREGREFAAADAPDARRVAIVNELMAKKYWPGDSAVGKRFRLWEQKIDCEVVGVAKDSKYGSLAEPAQPFFYLSTGQNSSPSLFLQIRTEGAAESRAAALRGELQAVDDNIPLRDLRSLRSHLASTFALPQLGAALVGYFALLGLVLALIGLYGAAAHTAAQRTREIGIRMALGATRGHVLTALLRRVLIAVSIGVGLGIVAGLVETRVLSALLYGVGALDLATLLVAAGLLVACALVAAFVPTLAATRVDPMLALRHE